MAVDLLRDVADSLARPPSRGFKALVVGIALTVLLAAALPVTVIVLQEPRLHAFGYFAHSLGRGPIPGTYLVEPNASAREVNDAMCSDGQPIYDVRLTKPIRIDKFRLCDWYRPTQPLVTINRNAKNASQLDGISAALAKRDEIGQVLDGGCLVDFVAGRPFLIYSHGVWLSVRAPSGPCGDTRAALSPSINDLLRGHTDVHGELLVPE